MKVENRVLVGLDNGLKPKIEEWSILV